MSLDADTIVDRRQMRRKITFWRVTAVVVAVLAVAALAATFGSGRALMEPGGHIARIKIQGLIRGNQARVDALDRLSRRADYTGPDEYAFCNRFGRRLDPSALRRRYDRARDAAGLPPLRFHDLRHTYGSLLVAGGIDLISVKSAMGHSQISTTERYLHARPATELADRFTTALGGVGADRADVGARVA